MARRALDRVTRSPRLGGDSVSEASSPDDQGMSSRAPGTPRLTAVRSAPRSASSRRPRLWDCRR